VGGDSDLVGHDKMKQFIIVGLGGCVGAIARYKLGGILLHPTTDWRFPISTFMVNVSGCFIAGVLSGLVEKHGFFGSDLRLFLFTGLLGGFTTFSAFGLETVYLFQRQEILVAITYLVASVLFGVLALWLGIRIIP
jgi:CrcB protein